MSGKKQPPQTPSGKRNSLLSDKKKPVPNKLNETTKVKLEILIKNSQLHQQKDL